MVAHTAVRVAVPTVSLLMLALAGGLAYALSTSLMLPICDNDGGGGKWYACFD